MVLLRGLGFTGQGLACNEYPSPRCPFHVELSWNSLCAGEGSIPCFMADGELRGEVLYNPSKKDLEFPYNSKNYRFLVLKSKKSVAEVEMISPVPMETASAEQIETAKKICDEIQARPMALNEIRNQLEAAHMPQSTIDSLEEFKSKCKNAL